MDRKYQRGRDFASRPRLSFPHSLVGTSSWPRVPPRDYSVRGTAWPPAIHIPSTDVSQTMIYTHVLNRGWAGVRSPADRLPLSAVPIGLPVPVDGRPLTLRPGLDTIMASGGAALLSRPPLQRRDRNLKRIGSRPD